jgi:hypothetical protein
MFVCFGKKRERANERKEMRARWPEEEKDGHVLRAPLD